MHLTISIKMAFCYKELRARGNYHLRSEGLSSIVNIWEKQLINNTSVTCNVVSNVLSAYHSLFDKKSHSIEDIHQSHNCILFSSRHWLFISLFMIGVLLFLDCITPWPLLFALWEQRFVCLYICLFLSSFIFSVHYLWHLKLEWCLEHSGCLAKVLHKLITDDK